MLVDKSDIGFGKRSWRYSMLVNDGVIEKMFIEEDKAGDPFEVSDADTMLTHINPSVKTIDGTTIFTKANCPFCKKAKDLLTKHNINFTDIPGIRSKALKSLGGTGTYPLIFIDKKLIGGADDLDKYFS
jgi:glutaredoxin